VCASAKISEIGRAGVGAEAAETNGCMTKWMQRSWHRHSVDGDPQAQQSGHENEPNE
jgi:hypothetical protein